MLVALLQRLHAKDNPPPAKGRAGAEPARRAAESFTLLPGTRVPAIRRRSPVPRPAPSRKAGEEAGWV
jgi:hypothetical protein